MKLDLPTAVINIPESDSGYFPDTDIMIVGHPHANMLQREMLIEIYHKFLDKYRPFYGEDDDFDIEQWWEDLPDNWKEYLDVLGYVIFPTTLIYSF